MIYAVVDQGCVCNLIELNPENATEFLNAVSIEDIPVIIGDTYIEGNFLRDGVKVKTRLNAALDTIATLQEQTYVLAKQVIDLQITLAETEAGA